MIQLEVDVTHDDIAKGKAGNCKRCPVAIAVKRAAEPTRLVKISVFGGYVEAENIDTEEALRAWNPERVQDRIFRFDQHGMMDPFKFKLEFFPQ